MTEEFRWLLNKSIIETLMNSFVYYPGSSSLILDSTGKKVLAPFTDPEFRAGLQWLNVLFKDGTLSPSIFTNDQTQFRAELNNNPPVVGLTGAGSFSNWPNAAENTNYAEMKLAAPFKGPKGAAWSPYRIYSPTPAAFITYKSTNPDLAFKVLESFYDLDLSLTERFGEEGVDWTRDPKILAEQTNSYTTEGIYPGIVLAQTDTAILSTPSKKIWRMTVPCYRDQKWMDARVTLAAPGTPSNPNAYTGLVAGIKARIYIPAHPQYLMPSIKYSLADQQKISEPQTNVRTYVDQAIAEFITGNGGRDINNNAHWNNYLSDLEKMGLQTWISAAQAAYDRMPK